jgi:peptide-methionine (S)-S-oxide reductase
LQKAGAYYLIRNPDQPYIVYNDPPKIENLKQLLADDYRDEPIRVSQATGIAGHLAVP